ncbi:putative SOS response-associated peptidase YedK [Rhizobium leguminosarum]|nr:putative SOS response-associated peptidase YedK [Rhizobium leguminosarum]
MTRRERLQEVRYWLAAVRERDVRKLSFPHWKPWFGIENRCLVTVTSFAEPDPASQEEGGKVPNAWFASDQEKSLMFFVGIHVPQWRSV